MNIKNFEKIKLKAYDDLNLLFKEDYKNKIKFAEIRKIEQPDGGKKIDLKIDNIWYTMHGNTSNRKEIICKTYKFIVENLHIENIFVCGVGDLNYLECIPDKKKFNTIFIELNLELYNETKNLINVKNDDFFEYIQNNMLDNSCIICRVPGFVLNSDKKILNFFNEYIKKFKNCFVLFETSENISSEYIKYKIFQEENNSYSYIVSC